MFKKNKDLRAFVATRESPAFNRFNDFVSTILLKDIDHSAILITSLLKGEGKSTISLNLSVHMAKAGKRTLLIDGNLEHPFLTEILNLNHHKGLTDLAKDRLPLPQIINKITDLDIDVIGNGSTVDLAPLRVFRSEILKEAFKEAKSIYDIVIVDAPCLSVSKDFFHLIVEIDKVIFVVVPEMVTKKGLLWAKKEVEKLQEKDVHILLNRYKEYIPSCVYKVIWG